MKVDDEVYIHSGSHKHKRALIVSLLPKMMNVRVLTGRKAGKMIRINQSSAVVVEAQYRTIPVRNVDPQPNNEPATVMGSNRSPFNAVTQDEMPSNVTRVDVPEIEGVIVDPVQLERENVANPTELMTMIQEEMDDVQMMANMITQRMNRIMLMMERIRLDPQE
jgi:ribosomal protein L24